MTASKATRHQCPPGCSPRACRPSTRPWCGSGTALSSPPKPAVQRATANVDVNPDAVERRALAYLDNMPPAISGAGGHAKTYAAAVALVHGFGIAPDRALGILLEHYNPRCEPPWSEKELRHKVDDAAAKEHERPFGWLRDQQQPPPVTSDADVDISAIVERASGDTAPDVADPGPVPDKLLRVPGFISEVMDFCLETAAFPNVPLAFGGALALVSLLTGRRFRAPGNIRPNLYLCCLANSGVGKNAPRELNQRIVRAVGDSKWVAGRIGSAEGLEDRVAETAVALFQTDEIDGMLQSINKSKDGSGSRLVSTLLELYTSSGSTYDVRVLAGKDARKIEQPSLTLFGTATPKHYYESISEAMMSNGFFARLLILDAGPRHDGQEARILDIPPRILETARYWTELSPGDGNLAWESPTPLVVPYGDGVEEFYRDLRELENSEYKKAQATDDLGGMATWARFGEKTRKLALLHALSERPQSPEITLAAVRWASEIVEHVTRRQLNHAGRYSGQSEFEKLCVKFIDALRKAQGHTLSRSKMLSRMRGTNTKELDEIVRTLVEREEVHAWWEPTGGRSRHMFRLLG